MDRISDISIQQVRQFNGIVDFIRQHVDLKRRGRNFIGLCPFHSEKSPSFTVSPEKKIFHCFGCHESGDLISFVQKIDNLTFYEAIENIAAYAGISIEKEVSTFHSKKQDMKTQKIISCLKLAMTYFLNEFNHSDKLKNYILSRDLSLESASEFNIGYLKSSDMFYNWLIEQGVESSIIDLSGLFLNSSNKRLSRFHERLIFPILDFQSRVVGFGGRTLDTEKSVAKYVNSEESKLFNKRRLLYGLYRAKSAIKKVDHMIVCEGYTDVIACHQFGFEQTVGCMGTSLTHEQIHLMKRLTDHVVLMMDGDAAGIKAMIRSYDLLKQRQMNVSVIELEGKDPLDFLSEFGQDGLQSKIDGMKPGVLFYFNTLKKQYDLTKIENISKVANEVASKLLLEEDFIIREHYALAVCRDLKIDSEKYMAKLMGNGYNNVDFVTNLNKKQSFKDKYKKAEEFIIYLISSDIDYRNLIRDFSSNLFVNDNLKGLLNSILSSTKLDAELYESLTENEAIQLSQILLTVDIGVTHNKKEEFNSCMGVLLDYQKQLKKEDLKRRIKEFEAQGNDKLVESLLLELSKL